MRPARFALVAVVVGAGPVLSACDTVQSFVNSMEGFEIWDSKKKLQGERRPVFPEGVPGVAAGVPAEMVKGYREPEQGVIDPARAAAEAAAADQQPRPKPKPQRTASKPPPKPKPVDPYASAGAPAQGAQPAAQPAAQPTAPWPAAPAAQPQAAWPGQQGTVAR